jgi:hypothetical protein
VTADDPGAVSEPETPRELTRVALYYKCNSADIQIQISINGGVPQTFDLYQTVGVISVQSEVLNGFADTVKIEKTAGTATFDLDKIGVYKRYASNDEPDLFENISQQISSTIAYPQDLDDPSEYYNYKQDYANGEKSLTMADGAWTRFYLGSDTQTQDASIMAWLDGRFGAGEGLLRTPAYLGMAYIVVDNRVLRSGRLENFTAECIEGSSVDLRTPITDLCADVGIASGDLSLTNIPSGSITGIVESSAVTRKAFIRNLLTWRRWRMADIDGKLTTIYETQSAADYALVEATDFVLDSEVQVIRKEPSAMPQQVRVSFMNESLDYHTDSVESDPIYTTPNLDIVEYTFPFVATRDQAKLVANDIHRKLVLEDRAFEWTGTPAMAKWTVGDVVSYTRNSKTHLIRIENIDRELPIGVIRYQGVATDQIPVVALNPKLTNVQKTVQPSLKAYPKYPRNTIIEPILSNAIRKEDATKTGLYLAISGRGRGHWENAALYKEKTTDNYEFLQIIDSTTPMGIGQAALSGTAGANSLEIYFFDDVDLESVTLSELNADPTLNLMRIGSEWIQFTTAVEGTVPDNSTYRSVWTVSGMGSHRGKFETSGTTETHSTEESCALFTKAMLFLELDDVLIDETINLKAVTATQQLANAPLASIKFSPPINNITKTLLSIYDSTTTAGTTGEVLNTLAISANQLGADGDMIQFHVYGTLAANANTKTAWIGVDGNDVGSMSTSQSGGAWAIHGSIIREDDSNVRIFVRSVTDDPTEGWTDYSSAAVDTTAAFDLTIEAHTASASGDLTLTGGMVRFIPGKETSTVETVTVGAVAVTVGGVDVTIGG